MFVRRLLIGYPKNTKDIDLDKWPIKMRLTNRPRDFLFLQYGLRGEFSSMIKRTCERTSDSLNEGLPIKMTREKFKRKWYFFL